MPDHTPPALPGDIVEVTTLGRRGALVVVEQAHAGRITGYMPCARTKDHPTEKVPVRLRVGEFARVGTVATATRELAKARAAAIEAISPPPPAKPAAPEGDTIVDEFDVEFRFNGRTTGAGQTHRVRVPTDNGTVEEAIAAAYPTLPVRDHGGSIFVTGVTVDEVRS